VRAWDLERQADELQTALESGWRPEESFGGATETTDVGGEAVTDTDAGSVEIVDEDEYIDAELLDVEELDDVDTIEVDVPDQGSEEALEGRELPSVDIDELGDGEQVVTLPPFSATPAADTLLEPQHDERTETDLEFAGVTPTERHPEMSASEPPVSEVEGALDPESQRAVLDSLFPSEAPTRDVALEGEIPSPRSEAAPAPAVSGIVLASVAGLQDLPDTSQAALAASVELHDLVADEEISGFALALVLAGDVALMPAIADVAAARAGPGEVLFAQGHLEEGVSVRVVAGSNGARVGSWSKAVFEQAALECPWAFDQLKTVGDRYQALAGITLGPMGERLDDMLRELVTARCEVMRLLPGEVIAEAGKPLRGMVVLGAGRIDLFAGDASAERLERQLSAGDFLFAPQILLAAPAPLTARAGPAGALILFAERRVAHELMVWVPPLLEILSD
ncbi:MAG TPA: hypothetical protein VER33_00970, partial [Polyangiaceae bacterium]|nr:hypothetical protein [Polyangiaceae bacterium]